MKKFLIIIGIIFIICVMGNKEVDLKNDAIRFRVIANSNSEEDISMKKEVVKEVSSTLFIDGSKEETRNNIEKSIPIIDEKINTLFNNNNYNKSYNIVYGFNEFPKKEYDNVVYPEGKYESLVIKIGEAKGENYWCFLYPSLCMIDTGNGENKVVLRSRIYDFFKDIFM